MRKFGKALLFGVVSVALLSDVTSASLSSPSALTATSIQHSKQLIDLHDTKLYRGGAVKQVEQQHDTKLYRGGAVKKVEQQDAAMATLLDRLKVGFYFGLWYFLNIIYNILNKKVLNVLPQPMMVGSMQLGVGCLYVGLLWLLRLRQAPTLTADGKKAVSIVGFWHATGQLASMVSLGAGPVSFTHIVKALEPFFSACVSALCFGKWMKPQVYATLIPVVGGVGYACLKERSFSWLAFWMAMLSNLAFAFRAVLSKVAMTGKDIGTNLTPTNVFGLVTLAAFLVSIPMALISEGGSFTSQWNQALETQDTMELIKAIIVSGMFHYLNNEVMYLALGSVHPVTLAVGNTMKRVFIMVASVMVFRNQITLQAGIGSAIGISGVLLYSLTKQYYEKLEAQEASSKKVQPKANKLKIKRR